MMSARDARAKVRALQRDILRLVVALDESVALQSHQAKMLNMYDGGKRRTFRNGDDWMARLAECGRFKGIDALASRDSAREPR